MAVYLVDHPPRIQQFRCPRRRSPSGIIGVHTAESFPDETGPDTGAESVAAFIARRTNPGSYHLLADSDSVIQLVEFDCVAYHIGTHGLNEHTIGISAATQAAKWNQLDPDHRRAMVRNMARAATMAARWLQRDYGITVPARRITLSQALNGQKGFLAHGDADPDRRTDPGATFPWGQFLDDYAAFMAGKAPTTPEDDVSEFDVIKALQSEAGRNAIATAVHGMQIGRSGKTAGIALEKMLTPATQLLAGTIGAQTLENGQPLTVAIVLQRLYNMGMASAGDLDEQRIAELTADLTADLLVERLPELPAGVDKDTVKTAVREVLREGVA